MSLPAPTTAPAPYTAKEVAPRGLFARLLGRAFPKQAEQAIANLFAAADPEAIDRATIEAAAEAQGVRGSALEASCRTVFRDAVVAYFSDGEFSDEEVAYLLRLQRALRIPGGEADALRVEVVTPTFARAVERAIADGDLTPAEREQLGQLADRLKLSSASATDIVAAAVRPMIEATLAERIRDRRYSPADEAAVRAVARALGVSDLSFDSTVRGLLEHYRQLWRIENGELPTVSVPIVLQRGETAHASFHAAWAEFRTRTQRVNYSGISGSIRIAKGIRYRVGTYAPQRVTSTELVELDRGSVYLTNKRVIFDGATMNKSVRWSSLIGIELFSDALQLEKASGKPVYLMVSMGDQTREHMGVLASELLARA